MHDATTFTTAPRRRGVVRTALLVLVAALSGAVVTASPAAAATTRERIVTLVTNELGGKSCNPGYLNSCGMDWCAEFARWAWKNAGITNLSGLNGYADSFRSHGDPADRYHSRGSGYQPQPGDAILFDWDHKANDIRPAEHVAIVTSVSGGKVHTIGGNQDGASHQFTKVSRASYALNYSDILGYTEPAISGEAPGVRRDADMDGNGFADMVAVTSDGTLQWYGNNGNGGFYSAREISKAGFKHMAFGDIDGNGRADILAVTNDDDLQWYPNNGSNGFYAARPLGKAGFKHMALGDIDGNGLADMLAVTNDDTLQWYPNNGDENNEGFYSARQISKAGFKHMALGDIDRNGLADMLAVTNDDTLQWYPNNGNGGFYSAREISQAAFQHLDA